MAKRLRRLPARAAYYVTALVICLFPLACLAILGRNALGADVKPPLVSAAYSLLIALIVLLALIPLSLGYALAYDQMRPSRVRRALRRGMHILGGVPPVACAAVTVLPAVALGGAPGLGWALLAMILGLVPRSCAMAASAIGEVPERYYLAGVALGAPRTDALLGVVFPIAKRRLLANCALLLSMAVDQMALLQLTLGFAPGLVPSALRPLPPLLLFSKQSGDIATAALSGILLILISGALSLSAHALTREGA